ncbi:hypothetical protein VNO77_41691 [Canavalia gladiata]|uniref:Uncharacterized protein n=1 Tax=Canavalia gladiata TaxID=3824 RepID=A0AAN9K154_CANGL
MLIDVENYPFSLSVLIYVAQCIFDPSVQCIALSSLTLPQKTLLTLIVDGVRAAPSYASAVVFVNSGEREVNVNHVTKPSPLSTSKPSSLFPPTSFPPSNASSPSP